MSSIPVSSISEASTACCPACGGESQFRFSKFEYQYFGCDCGLVFTWPRPSEQELEEYYREDGEQYWATESMVEFAFSPTKSRREVRFLCRFAKHGKLLDIGCSTGSFVKAAREAGFEAEGVDIAAPSVQLGQKFGLPLRPLDVLHESPGSDYDIVTLWGTLEHLSDPRRYLRRAREFLKPGGLLLLTVPNYAGISQRLLGKWDRYVSRGHLNYFTPRVLRRTLEAEHFSYRGFTTFSFNPIFLLKDFKNRGKRSPEGGNLIAENTLTLKFKHSPLLYVQRGCEWALNLFSAGDAIAMCAAAPPRG